VLRTLAARERVAVPFWGGILSALAAVAMGMAIATIAGVLLIFAIVLVTGNAPSTAAGHPLNAMLGIVFYVATGAVAWRRLRSADHPVFRAPTRSDVRATLIGIGALFVVHLATGIQLVLTNQTKHVQAGFEHFSVAAKTPSLTIASIVLTVLTLVVLAPVVEEMVFRGLIFGALAPRIGVLAAALLSALLFGLVHGDQVLFPTLAALGFINALLYANTGNLLVPITLHALNNAIAATALIAASLQH
jgi:membrane protease YdiL (CAAX protease family)